MTTEPVDTVELFSTRDQFVWAREFCRVAREIKFDPADPEHEDWVAAWMANAMMHGDDWRANTIRREWPLYRFERWLNNKWHSLVWRLRRLTMPRIPPIARN